MTYSPLFGDLRFPTAMIFLRLYSYLCGSYNNESNMQTLGGRHAPWPESDQYTEKRSNFATPAQEHSAFWEVNIFPFVHCVPYINIHKYIYTYLHFHPSSWKKFDKLAKKYIFSCFRIHHNIVDFMAAEGSRFIHVQDFVVTLD